MLRVVVADDEKRICELIKNMIPWEEMGIELVGMAGNGPATYELVKKELPDVLITDVRMPGYDGIELTRRLRESGICPHVIIISGYRHFEYAHNALQYGVEHYLLKPISQPALVEALNSIRSREAQKAKECDEKQSIRRQMAEGKTKLHRQLIRACLTDTLPVAEAESLQALNAAFHTSFAPGVLRAVILKLDVTTHNDVNIDRILEKIYTIAEDILRSLCFECATGSYANGVAVILNYEEGKEALIKSGIEKAYAQVQDLVDMFDCFQLTVAIGGSYFQPKDLVQGMRTADLALKSRVFAHKGNIIEYDPLWAESVPVPQVLSLEKQGILRSHLETGQTEKIKALLTQLMGDIEKLPKRSPALLHDLSAELRAIVTDVSHKAGVDEEAMDFLLKKYDGKVENAASERMLYDAAFDFLEKAAEMVFHKQRFDNTKPVRIAKEYMDQHYMDHEIGLEVLAQEAHIGSAYLSSLFRRETGVNITEYLTHVRMEAAKQLLRRTNDSLMLVAEKVGYADPKYFSKLFRKEVGLKPSDYRKLYT